MDASSITRESLSLGPFDVATDAGLVAAFAQATRGVTDAVPATLPIAWLAHPDIRAAIERFVQSGEVPFHEDQSFDYGAALKVGAAYRLTAHIARHVEPARIVLDSAVADASGRDVLAMRTVLRLIAVPEGALADRQAQADASAMAAQQ